MNSNTRKKNKTRKQLVNEDLDDNDNSAFSIGYLFTKFMSFFTDDNQEQESVKRQVKTKIKKVKIIDEEKKGETDSDKDDDDENVEREIVVKKLSKKMRKTQKNR